MAVEYQIYEKKMEVQSFEVQTESGFTLLVLILKFWFLAYI